MTQKEPDRTFSYICELLEDITDFACDLRESRGDNIFDTDGKGHVEKRFKLSSKEDVAKAVMELIFGEIEAEKKSSLNFFEEDLPHLLKMHDLIQLKGYTQENAVMACSENAKRKSSRVQIDSVETRLVKNYRIFLKMKEEATRQNMPLNKFMRSRRAQITGDDRLHNELFLFGKWFFKYKGELKKFYDEFSAPNV